jgi:hypothetical protein
MTIARIIAITAVVCAAMGMTTQAEAAKRTRIPAGHIALKGCAHLVPLACTVMGSGSTTYVLHASPDKWVPWHTPIIVLARKTSNVGLCFGTHVQVVSWIRDPDPKARCVFQ